MHERRLSPLSQSLLANRGSEEELTRAVEAWLGPGIHISATGLKIDRELSFEEWLAGLKKLLNMSGALGMPITRSVTAVVAP